MMRFDAPMTPAASISFSQSESARFPERSTCASTRDSKENIRFTSCSFDISSEKIAAVRLLWNATYCAIFKTNAVFPIDGLAATRIRSDG